MPRRTIIGIGLAVFVSLVLLDRVAAHEVSSKVIVEMPAQTTDVVFMLPRDVAFFRDGSEIVLFTGRSQGTVNTSGCTFGGDDSHVQQVVLVDPGGGRAALRADAVVLDPTDSLPPGSRLSVLDPLNVCEVGGTVYILYRGRMQ